MDVWSWFLDDYMVVFGMVFSWGLNIIGILASQTSLGHHTKVLPLSVLESFYRHLYAFQILYSLSISCVKFSVVFFQYRIFPIASFRRIITICGVFLLAFEIASTLVFIFECTPIRDFWVTLSGHLSSKLGGRCIHVKDYLLANGSVNTFTDFALIILPLPLLWRLRASTLQKYVLIGIFVSGLVVTAVSMVRLVVLARYHGSDVTYDFVPTFIWTAAEPSIGVASACLPSLRPLFVQVFRLGPRRVPPHHEDGLSSSNNLASTWRSGNNAHDRSFNRLPDTGRSRTGSLSNSNNVAIYGGKGKGAHGVEEDIMELGSQEEEVETPINRIRAKTTVVLTVSEKVDWQDDLF